MAALLAFGLAGCSITSPFERAPATGAASEAQIVTGSIASPRPPSAPWAPLSSRLDQEDWRRASAALATALDPQGNGAVVRWENEASGHKGSFAPVGDPYLVKDEICRSFVAALTVDAAERWLQGSACRAGPLNWSLKSAQDWKRPT